MLKYLIAFSLFFGLSAENTFAQKLKYGYVNADKILSEMPEIEIANKELEVYVKEINDYINSKNEEFKKKQADFQLNEKNLSDIIKTDRQEELNKLAANIKQFQLDAQNTINKKKQDLYQSAIVKLKDAIKAVAKENSYRFIIDNSDGKMLYCEEEDNVDKLVLAKLGILKK
jgi:outer membrane protein